jgi:hypothetical protein
MAHLKTKATRGNARERLAWKVKLVRELYQRGYEREEVLELFRFVDWLLVLPDEDQARWHPAGHCRDHRRSSMIVSEKELGVTLDRIARFQRQLSVLRKSETNPANYHASASGFLAEIDRMQLEVREYLSLHPAELAS